MEEKEIKGRQENEKIVIPDKKEEKKSKKRVFLLLLLLLITGFLLTTTTYAWFTSNKTVTVSDINVNVATSGGIQISVDGTSWKSIISNTDITDAVKTYAAATNQLPSTLQPVSTAANSLLNGGYLPMWYGTVVSNAGGDYIITATDASTVTDNSKTSGATGTGTNGYFVAFDLFFKLDADGVDNTSSKIYLTTSSDVVAQTDTGIKNASRVAFIIEGETDNGSDLATIQGLTASTVNNNVFVWEPNYDVHTPTGVNNAADVYGITTKTTGGSLLSYSGITAAIAADDNILLGDATATKHSDKFADIVPTHSTTANWGTGTAFKELFTLNTNKITKVRIYFWVEGQDVDCENNASGGEITLKLQFSLLDKAAAAP